MKQYFFLLLFVLMFCFADAQAIQQLTGNPKISLRGLSVVTDNIIWASGSNGQVVKSTDGGKHFEWITVKNYEKKDFRDIEAFDANTALIMAVDSPAVILKTKDGGKTWIQVFRDDTKGMFLDAMDFDADRQGNEGYGIVVGDPINKVQFTAMNISDSGSSWRRNLDDEECKKCKSNPKCPLLLNDGEAFFAASGTNVKILANYPLFVSGGMKSRLITFDTAIVLPIIQGSDSKGANSIAISEPSSDNEIKGVIVGGDFKHDTVSSNNCVLFNYNMLIGSKAIYNFSHPLIPPHGYRSCVAFITNNSLVCCGLTGIDISNDGGINWKLISNESFNVCAKAKKGNAVFLAGKDGRIAMLKND